MLKAGLSCLPRGCKCLVLKSRFLKDACLLDKPLSKSLWHPGRSNAVVLACKAAVSQRQGGAEGPWRTVIQQPCTELSFPPVFSLCAYAPHWFDNDAGLVLLSICMLTLRNIGENKQGQCRKPESQRSKVGDPGCVWSVSGFHDVFDISSSAVVMFLVEEVQRNIFDQRCVENELWNR